MSSAITLSDEIASLKRELGMRKRVYPNQQHAAKTVREREELKVKHAHEIACTEATLARLEALIPKQSTLF